MPTRKPPKELDPAYLERAFVQVNVRVPLNIRVRADEFLEFMGTKNTRRPKGTEDWPRSLSGLVITALDEYLDSHPTKERTGPDKKEDYRRIRTTVSKIKPKPEVVDQEGLPMIKIPPNKE